MPGSTFAAAASTRSATSASALIFTLARSAPSSARRTYTLCAGGPLLRFVLKDRRPALLRALKTPPSSTETGGHGPISSAVLEWLVSRSPSPRATSAARRMVLGTFARRGTGNERNRGRRTRCAAHETSTLATAARQAKKGKVSPLRADPLRVTKLRDNNGTQGEAAKKQGRLQSSVGGWVQSHRWWWCWWVCWEWCGVVGGGALRAESRNVCPATRELIGAFGWGTLILLRGYSEQRAQANKRA